MDGHTEGLVESVLGADKKPVTWRTTKRPEIGSSREWGQGHIPPNGKFAKLSTPKCLLRWYVLVTFPRRVKKPWKNGRRHDVHDDGQHVFNGWGINTGFGYEWMQWRYVMVSMSICIFNSRMQVVVGDGLGTTCSLPSACLFDCLLCFFLFHQYW